MKQSWEEYVEGRLQFGGCVLKILIIIGIIFAICAVIINLIEDFSVMKLVAYISFIPAAVVIIWTSFLKR